jgi:LCP family protein required for cell wall assembly
MSQWRDGWSDDDGRGGEAEPTRVMGHVQRPGGYPPQQGAVPHPAPPSEPPLPPELSPRRAAHGGATIPAQSGYGNQGGYGDQGGYGTQPGYGDGGGGGPYGPSGGGGRPSRPSRPRSWRRRITWTVLVLVVALVVTSVVTYFWADNKLNRAVDLSHVEDRPTGGKGTNYLIVGSDSRQGMSEQEKKALHTGTASGGRTDSMIILHTGSNGTTMLSLPRDSWVTIPAFTGSESGRRIPASQNKLNAAFSIQGPELLVRTIEYNTGLHIDHYAEIGFGGFANIVDSVGGVHMCLDHAIKDRDSGADLKAGCQKLNGAESLAFVRERHQEALGDLGRTKHQQQFLSALAHQVAKPTTVLNPFKLYPTMGAGLDSLTVDKNMSLWNLTRMFWAMKGVTGGDGKQMNVPVSDLGFATSKGSAVKWDMAKAKTLFGELKNDEKVTVQG